MAMSDDLREQIARVLRDAMFPDFAGEPCGGRWPDYADAVLAVVQPVIEQAERERDEARAERASLVAARDFWINLFDDRHNRAIAAEERAEQLSQQVAGLLSELRAAEGERDRWHASYEEEVEVRSCVERERDDLRAALTKAGRFMNHQGVCRWPEECTCGLAGWRAVLGEQEAAPPECPYPGCTGPGSHLGCALPFPASAPQGEAEPPNYRDEDGTYPTYPVPLFAPQGEGNTDE